MMSGFDFSTKSEAVKVLRTMGSVVWFSKAGYWGFSEQSDVRATAFLLSGRYLFFHNVVCKSSWFFRWIRVHGFIKTFLMWSFTSSALTVQATATGAKPDQGLSVLHLTRARQRWKWKYEPKHSNCSRWIWIIPIGNQQHFSSEVRTSLGHDPSEYVPYRSLVSQLGPHLSYRWKDQAGLVRRNWQRHEEKSLQTEKVRPRKFRQRFPLRKRLVYHGLHRTSHANPCRSCTFLQELEHTSPLIASSREDPRLHWDMIIRQEDPVVPFDALISETKAPPINLICVVMFIPTTTISAPEVKTMSAASGSL